MTRLAHPFDPGATVRLRVSHRREDAPDAGIVLDATVSDGGTFVVIDRDAHPHVSPARLRAARLADRGRVVRGAVAYRLATTDDSQTQTQTQTNE